MGTREFVFGLLSNDLVMNGLGISMETLYANGAPDSPPVESVFAVLRWDQEANQGLKRIARGFDVSLWVYDRNADYGQIRQIIKRWCDLMEATPGMSTGDGWVIGCDWAGNGRDDFDDIYERHVKDSHYTIVASGE